MVKQIKEKRVNRRSLYIPVLLPTGGRAGYKRVILRIRQVRKDREERERRLKYKFD